MKVLQISGRRWFSPTEGNTYFSSVISIDGEHVHTIDREYGYGQMYEQAASEWLIKNDYLPKMNSVFAYPLASYCEENGIIFICQAVDVQRERDL